MGKERNARVIQKHNAGGEKTQALPRRTGLYLLLHGVSPRERQASPRPQEAAARWD